MGDQLQEQLAMTLEMLRENIRKNEETTRMLLEENRALRQDLSKLRDKVDSIPKKENKLKQQVIRKFRRKRKDIIKSKIIEQAHIKQMTVSELKEIIVDDQEYCSKATFYRYIKEIIKEGLIHLAGEIVEVQND